MVFRGQIAEFTNPAYSVFTRKDDAVVSWKPVLLLNRESVAFFIYVSFVRHSYYGLWYIFLRSLATEEAVRHLRCKVTLRAASSSPPPPPPPPKATSSVGGACLLAAAEIKPPGVATATAAPPAAVPAPPPPHRGKDSPMELTFTGPVHSHKQTNAEIIETGRFLFFRDEQVKAMAATTGGPRTPLFDYEVEVLKGDG